MPQNSERQRPIRISHGIATIAFAMGAGYGLHQIVQNNVGNNDLKNDLPLPYETVLGLPQSDRFPTYTCLVEAQLLTPEKDALYQATLCYMKRLYQINPDTPTLSRPIAP